MNGWGLARVLICVVLALVPVLAFAFGASADPGDYYTITASAGTGGSIDPSGDVLVAPGASQTFTITPNTGYMIQDVLVDGSSVGPVTSYPFTNVTEDHTISASFRLKTYTISASVTGGNGTISPSGNVSVNHGASQTFTITPNTGYMIQDVLVDGSSVGPVTSYQFTNVTANHTISASFTLRSFSITPSAGSGGSISPATVQTVTYGSSSPVFTITPNTGYMIQDVLVDGSSVGPVTSYQFTNVTANHTISASFAIITYTLTYNAGPNGTISGTTPQTVPYGGNGTPVTAVPGTGYHFVSWSDGVLTATRTDLNVTANKTVTATFAIDTFTLTPTAGANGTITPASATTVNYGGTQTFTITPALGYHVADVLVDGVSVGAVSTYTFTNVTANHTIRATFAINTYRLTPTAGPNGSITPGVVQTVDYGASRTFTITPAAGYYIADVRIDGVSVGPVPSYTFANVTADHTISASFAVGTQTRLAISVSKTIVDYGGSTLLDGALYDAGDPANEVGMGGRTVTVQSSTSATGPWSDVQSLTTSLTPGSVGSFSLSVAPTASTYYRLRFVAGAGSTYGDSLSFVVRVGVRPLLGTPRAPSAVKAKRSFSVYGTLLPSFSTDQMTVMVKVYRYKNRKWVYVREVPAANIVSGTATRYTVALKLTTRGSYRFRAYTVATPLWVSDVTALSKTTIVR